MSNVIKAIATFFYTGYLPMRGTFASLFALLLYYIVRDSIGLYIFTTLFLIVLGFLVSSKAEKIFGAKDPGEVTIDEASGMMVALFLVPKLPIYVISGFILFRLFDIVKPPPIKRLEDIGGAPGIMLDDILAGIYANLILQVVYYITLL